ncbi:hypothetical protein BJX70DRAFT_375755 [Aspergillus crustosus]
MDSSGQVQTSRSILMDNLNLTEMPIPGESKLELLPNELLYRICHFLPTPDQTCLSLSSKTLKLVLYASCRTKSLARKDRLSVLSRLSRYLPDQFLCWFCASLHRSTSINPPTSPPITRFRTKRICHVNTEETSSRYRSLVINSRDTFYDFQQSHLFLAMKRLYFGPEHGISLDSLSCTEVIEFEEHTTLMSIKARICHPSQSQFSPDSKSNSKSKWNLHPRLILQVQNWLLINDPDPTPQTISRLLQNLTVCKHKDAESLQIYIYNILVRQAGWGRAKAPISSDHICPHCTVNFQLDMRDCGPEGKAVVLTKWLDLGAGRDVDDKAWVKLVDTAKPRLPSWTSIGIYGPIPGHLLEQFLRRDLGGDFGGDFGVEWATEKEMRARAKQRERAGAVRRMYQSGLEAEDVLASDPTRENFLLLLDRKYRTVMKRVWGDREGKMVEVWRLPGEREEQGYSDA